MTEPTNWPDTSVLGFERLLDFDISAAETSKPAKQLACARCHGQKLRCVRRTRDARGCDRCLAANVECITRQPQRMGRPADTTSARHSARSSRSHADRRQRSAQIPSVSLSPTDIAIDYSSTANQFGLDRWAWPSPPADAPSAAPTGGSATNTTQVNSDSSSSGPAQPNIELSSYAGSLGKFVNPNALLPSFEDLSNLFPGGIDTASFEPLRTPETSDGAADGHSPLDDPVEHLSRLHLELYHCLVSVKSVEKMKRDRLRCPSRRSGNDVDTSWSENLFRTTEHFIKALRGYVAPGSITLAPSTAQYSAVAATDDNTLNGREDMVDNPGPCVDTATGLMIVSCYTRLVQIFDVVVFVVETFRDMDCPGSYVQVRFGSFAPTANKTFQARMLGQYVLHLLDDLSEAVNRAVASRQPYARAVVEVRRNEAKLKERILATLH